MRELTTQLVQMFYQPGIEQAGPFIWLGVWFMKGPFLPLFFGLLFMLATWFGSNTIKPVERIEWSWTEVRKRSRECFLFGALAVLAIWIIGGPGERFLIEVIGVAVIKMTGFKASRHVVQLTGTLASSLFMSLLASLMLALPHGLKGKPIGISEHPNQAISNSIRFLGESQRSVECSVEYWAD